MTDLQLDLEAIVREVLRRLEQPQPPAAPAPAAAPSPAAPDAPPGASSPVPPRPPAAAGSPVQPTQPPSAKPRNNRPSAAGLLPGTLRIRDRVVTLANLAERLPGVKVLLVPAGAVVTPSVRDELRKRNIRLEMDTQPEGRGDSPAAGLLVAVADGGFDVDSVVRAIETEAGQVRRIGGGELSRAVEQLTGAMAAARQPAVLVTSEPAAALCLANRQAGVRAAWAAGPLLTERACRAVGANLLVLDPAAQSTHQLRGMVRQFLQTDHECPAALQAALGGSWPETAG